MGRSRRIGDDLTEVGVVGLLKLLFHDHDVTGRLVVADEIQTSSSDGMLGRPPGAAELSPHSHLVPLNRAGR